MVHPTPTCLRATRLVARLQPPLGLKPAASILPSFTPISRHQSRPLTSSTRLQTPPAQTPHPKNFILSAQHAPSSHPIPTPSRPASTTTASSSTTSQSPTPSSSSEASSTSTANSPLTWNRYLHLRTIRRRYNLAASGVSALATTVVGAGVIANQDPENIGIQAFGLDPIAVMGIATLACGAVGWVLGPFAGSAIWRLVYRSIVRGGWEAKEKDFYRRIVKYRTPPTGQSVNNPVPDYYGEKITSVKDYRRWLKDQRAFRRKRDG